MYLIPKTSNRADVTLLLAPSLPVGLGRVWQLFFCQNLRRLTTLSDSATRAYVRQTPKWNKRHAVIDRGGSLSAMAGPEPVVVDDVPKRRSSVARPGGGSLAGLQADDDDSTMPASPELMKGSSEMQLLESAGTLSVVREERAEKSRPGWQFARTRSFWVLRYVTLVQGIKEFGTGRPSGGATRSIACFIPCEARVDG